MSGWQPIVEWADEALAPLGRVSARAMMGGAAVYCDGVIFALVIRDELWFKSDGETDPAWDAAGCERFSYTRRNGRSATMNYRRAPTDIYDDPDEMIRWARVALEAGRRAPVKKKRRR